MTLPNRKTHQWKFSYLRQMQMERIVSTMLMIVQLGNQLVPLVIELQRAADTSNLFKYLRGTRTNAGKIRHIIIGFVQSFDELSSHIDEFPNVISY